MSLNQTIFLHVSSKMSGKQQTKRQYWLSHTWVQSSFFIGCYKVGKITELTPQALAPCQK